METILTLVLLAASIWAVIDMYNIMATHGGKNGKDIYVGKVAPIWWILGYLFLWIPTLIAYIVARKNFLR